MKYISALALPLIGLSGCVAVPLPQSQRTFSYNNIVNQVECETYLAVLALEKDPKYEWASLSEWGMNIVITPSSTIDGQIGFGGSHNSKKGDDYFQWLAGGTNASPGGLTYEHYGSNSAKAEYQIPIASLFATKKDQNGNAITDANGNPVFILAEGKKTLEPKLKCLLPLGSLKDGVPRSAFFNGYFGIKQFLSDALPGDGSLQLIPTTIGYSKQYRATLEAGVTAGWYVPLGNTSPAIGGYGIIDNTIAVTFTPIPKYVTPPPVPVYTVANPTIPRHIVRAPVRPSTKQKQQPATTAKPAATSTQKPLSFPLPPDASNRLTNGSNFLLQQQYLRDRNPGFGQ